VSDPRVEKEVHSLSSYGFKVVVLAWNREGTFKNFESIGNRSIIRFNLRAPYRNLTIMLYYPFFWLWLLIRLLQLKPEIVHACDLDTVFPSLFYRFLNPKAKVVFDVFDTYTLLIQAKSEFLGNIVRPIELFAASKSDALVTVSDVRLSFFSCVNLRQTEIIMNCPPLNFSSFKVDENKRDKNVFRLVYAGAIAPHRGLLEVARAIQVLDSVEFVVAGRVIDIEIADRLCHFSCVKYVGQLTFDDSLKLEMSADVIPVLYDPRMPINRVAEPNKLYEAMLLGIPIITNLPCILDDVQFGVKVDYDDLDEIRKAIVSLKEHPTIRSSFGTKGRLAFEQKYNWFIMERKLIALYRQLLANQTLHYQTFVDCDSRGGRE